MYNKLEVIEGKAATISNLSENNEIKELSMILLQLIETLKKQEASKNI